MTGIKPEHVLLTVEELLDNYISKQVDEGFLPDQGSKNAITRTKNSLKGEGSVLGCGVRSVPPPERSYSIYFLPQLLAIGKSELKNKMEGIGKVSYDLIEPAITDLGYSIGQLSKIDEITNLTSNAKSRGTGLDIVKSYDQEDIKKFPGCGSVIAADNSYGFFIRNEKNSELLENINRFFEEKVAHIETEIRQIFEQNPHLITDKKIEFELPLDASQSIIAGLLLEKLGTAKMPDPKSEFGLSFYNAVQYIETSVSGVVAIIQSQYPTQKNNKV
jgi:hypothetical protein